MRNDEGRWNEGEVRLTQVQKREKRRWREMRFSSNWIQIRDTCEEISGDYELGGSTLHVAVEMRGREDEDQLGFVILL